MSLNIKIASSLLALSLVAGSMAATTGHSQAGSLSKGEVAAIAGIGGLVLGLGIASASRGPYYHYDSWQAHVERCYAHYKTYDHRTDTYISLSGYPRRCKL